MDDVVKKWTYVEEFLDSKLKIWGTNDFEAKDRVVTIDSRTKRLIRNSTNSADFDYSMPDSIPAPPTLIVPDSFRPLSDSDAHVVYGVAPGSITSLRVPYNRVDYYVKRPLEADKTPTRCNPQTGILYKAVLNHSDGRFTEYPLLEVCCRYAGCLFP